MTKSAAEKIARQVEETVDQVVHDLRKAGRKFDDRAEQQMSRAVATVNEGAKQLAERTQVAAEKTAATVRANPIKSVAVLTGVAALIGYALGRGLRKRR